MIWNGWIVSVAWAQATSASSERERATTVSGQADTGMVGSETENPGPGRDTRQTDPAATAGAEDPEATAAMSDTDLDRTRLGSHEPGPARH